MSATRHETRVGWCPSVATPMQAHDGLLVRIKPTAAIVSASAARVLADASARLGNGEIDLTNRANLQIRGLRADTVDEFAKAMREAGLASPDGAFEEVRNVTADPLGPEDPHAALDSHTIARSIEAMLARDTGLRALPPKFGFLVNCGQTLPVPDGRADVILRAVGDRLMVRLDGGVRAVPCSADDAPDLAGRLAHAFLERAGPADAPPYRMRELVEAIGEDAVFAEAGFTSDKLESSQPPHWAPDQVRGVGPSCGGDSGTDTAYVPGSTREPEAARGADTCFAGDASLRDAHLALMYAAPPGKSPLGWIPFVGQVSGSVVAGIPRGRLRAETLSELADLAERFADGTLRLAPWRAIAFAPVAADRATALMAALGAFDLIIDPADPRRALRGHDFTPVDIRNHRKAALP